MSIRRNHAMRWWARFNLNSPAKLALAAAAFLFLYAEGVSLRADEINKTPTDCQLNAERQRSHAGAIEPSPDSNSADLEARQTSTQSGTQNSDLKPGAVKCPSLDQKNRDCPTSIQNGAIPTAKPPCSSDPSGMESKATGARHRRGVPMEVAPTMPPHVSPVEGQKDLIEVIRPDVTPH
jgi:hypothetical protein